MTTTPSIETVSSMTRIASTAARSAPSLSPRPTQRPAASAAASVTRTSSRARFRSGAPLGGWSAPAGVSTDSRCLAIAVVLSGEALEDGGGGGGFEQDAVDLCEEGHVLAGPLGECADVPGR